ncbi:phytanoyl-CoA dioxygenase family protein [Actinomadura syzygii]|uniref:Phytanoyl-CoA dioxygenase family protein n=1 Tax=Actinomadura syzygii TaxID=1427538 RepID=A0A5D0TSM7_9ACTN|nr:phytanoyl-CoA dioxygenase family protein [Actinomadura syzygii]TYC08714.1 phytanoyl-CoA dioxygenase family protein [Actinomadura syzygii]
MSNTPPETAQPDISAGWAVQDLRSQGATYPLWWADAATARDLAARLEAEHATDRTEVVRNPHRDQEWARSAACALLDIVRGVLGEDVAIENTFLVLKWPGAVFEVPWHQDGIDRRIHLDPARSVSAWLALTDATVANGCLQIVPGSHALGYLPYELEDNHGGRRGRAGQAVLGERGLGEGAVPVPVAAGNAIAFDVALLHRSGANTSPHVRIGLNIRYVAPGAADTRDGSVPILDPISGTAW